MYLLSAAITLNNTSPYCLIHRSVSIWLRANVYVNLYDDHQSIARAYDTLDVVKS